MTKITRALTGNAKNAYFERVIASGPRLATEAHANLSERLHDEVVQIWVREGERAFRSAGKLHRRAIAKDIAPIVADRAAINNELPPEFAATEPQAADEAPTSTHTQSADITSPFDPFTPNIVVIVRTKGAEAALAALEAINETADLKLLAREQQLGLDDELCDPAAIRAAIIAAAERRIANRRAAAS